MTGLRNQKESVPFVKATLTNLTLSSEDFRHSLNSAPDSPCDLGDGLAPSQHLFLLSKIRVVDYTILSDPDCLGSSVSISHDAHIPGQDFPREARIWSLGRSERSGVQNTGALVGNFFSWIERENYSKTGRSIKRQRTSLKYCKKRSTQNPRSNVEWKRRCIMARIREVGAVLDGW